MSTSSHKLYGPRWQTGSGLFHVGIGFLRKAVSICLIFLVVFSLKFEFDPSGKSLPESHHRDEIKPAPQTARGLFL